MASALDIRSDYSAADLRRLAKRSKDNNQSRRLLSLAAVMDGMNRTDAARIGGMDRQTLRDWVHRFNELGPDGLLDRHGGGTLPRLSKAQMAELDAVVEAGPDRAKDGVVSQRLTLQRQTREFGDQRFEIHHRSEDSLDDRWDNLLCVHKNDHDKLHPNRVNNFNGRNEDE